MPCSTLITDAFFLPVGSFLHTLGIPKPGCFASFTQGHSFASLIFLGLLALFCIFACLHLRCGFYVALCAAFLYPKAFRATMFGSCISQLSFCAFCLHLFWGHLFFSLQLKFFAFSGKVCLSTSTDYKQKDSRAKKSALQRGVFKSMRMLPA